MNGKGQCNCSDLHEFVRWCTPTERYEFVVEQGASYRLRLIAATSRVGIKFAISQHSLTVVSRQGLDIPPFETNELSLFLGDRYDVILRAVQPIAEYKIRAQITGCDACNADGTTNNQPNFGYKSWAALRYEGATKFSAGEFSMAQAGLSPVAYNDARIVPSVPPSIPAATRRWVLNLTSERYWLPNDVAPHRKWFFNDVEFSGMMTQVPLLFRVLNGESFSAEKDLVFTAQYGDVVDLIFNTKHNQDHPYAPTKALRRR